MLIGANLIVKANNFLSIPLKYIYMVILSFSKPRLHIYYLAVIKIILD